jgi:hypothetical protein
MMSSLPGTGRRILSVVGPHSGCGKTLFVTHLARHVLGLGCLKVRPAHHQSGADATGERPVRDDFYLEDSAALDDPGGDTALYLAAGAVQVEILRHRGSGLAAGLDAALDRFPPSVPVVIESSSAVRFLRPVAVVLIVRLPRHEMKPSTHAILPRVTDLLVNSSKTGELTTATAEKLRREYPALRPRFTWSVDLTSEAPPAEMLARLRTLLAASAAGHGSTSSI